MHVRFTFISYLIAYLEKYLMGRRQETGKEKGMGRGGRLGGWGRWTGEEGMEGEAVLRFGAKF